LKISMLSASEEEVPKCYKESLLVLRYLIVYIYENKYSGTNGIGI